MIFNTVDNLGSPRFVILLTKGKYKKIANKSFQIVYGVI